MKKSRFLTTILLMVSLHASAEEGGVISGGPNARPDDKIPEIPLPIGGTKKDSEPALKLPPLSIELPAEVFRVIAMKAVINKSGKVYVNSVIGDIKPLALDLVNNRILGETLDGNPISLEEGPSLDDIRSDFE